MGPPISLGKPVLEAGGHNETFRLEDIAVISSSSWVERLILTVFSYSIILLPIAFVVITAQKRLLPASIRNSTLVQWFVFGGSPSTRASSYAIHNTPLTRHDDTTTEKLLPNRQDILSSRKSASQDTSAGSSLVFLYCFFGLQLSYLVWGVLQEKIMTTKYEVTTESISARSNATSNVATRDRSTPSNSFTFHDSQFLVFINRIVAFILSILALVYNRPKAKLTIHSIQPKSDISGNGRNCNKPQVPLYKYVYCSLSNILSSWCQYEALKYVNFPTQVLSKSCKVIPVMLVSKIMLNKRYQTFDYVCAAILSLGMFIFLLNQPPHSKTSNLSSTANGIPTQQASVTDPRASNFRLTAAQSSLVSGLIILALYLAFDAFTSNWQSKLFINYSVTNWQMMAATNFYSILLTLTSLHQLGNLGPALKLLASSSSLMLDCVAMSLMSSIGQLFVYYTIKRFGSVMFAVIMTMRQFIAILLSCVIYGHRVTMGSSTGIIVVFLVVAMQMWHKSRANSNKDKRPEPGQKQSLTMVTTRT